MVSPNSLVTVETARTTIGTLPTLHPRPTATSIRALYTHLREALAKIPSFQSPNHGYQGMVDAPEIYALTGEVPWVQFPDPGFHRQADGTLDATGQRDADAIFTAASKVYTSQQNVKAAVNEALNVAIPRAYRRNAGVIGVREFRANDDPREIIATLTRRYGQKTTQEVNEQDDRWRKEWNPAEPIEELIDRLEDCFIFAVYMPPPYTMEQLIERAHTQVKRTGLYPTAVVEWEGFDPANKTWPEWKAHFIEAYELRETSGITAAQAGYHGAAFTEEDDSLDESLARLQLANSAAMKTAQDNISAVTDETRELRAALVATQQQLANLMRGQGPPPGMYGNNAQGWPEPPPIQYAAPAAQYAPPPFQAPTYTAPPVPPPNQHPPPNIYTPAPTGAGGGWQAGGQGGYHTQPGGRGRGGRGQGGRGRHNAAYGRGPPQRNPGGYGGRNSGRGWTPNPQHPVKRFNNWNMCFSCGWDVPVWHTSKTCPHEYRKPGHVENCDRSNANGLIAAGHDVSKKGMHKTQLPQGHRAGFE